MKYYDDKELSENWLTEWLDAWLHQVITEITVDWF